MTTIRTHEMTLISVSSFGEEGPLVFHVAGRVLALGLVLLASLPWVLASREIDQKVPMSSRGEVSVEIIAGSLTFLPTDEAELRIKGTLGDHVKDLEIDADGESIEIGVEVESGARRGDSFAELTIYLPSGASIDVESVAAGISVKDLRGSIDIEVVSGDVHLSGIGGAVDIDVISGDVELGGESLQSAAIETVSGSISVNGGLVPGERYDFETVSGDIELTVPSSVSARFEIATFSGEIKNDFGQAPERESRWVPSKTLRFETGGGSARVSIECFSGTVKLRKH